MWDYFGYFGCALAVCQKRQIDFHNPSESIIIAIFLRIRDLTYESLIFFKIQQHASDLILLDVIAILPPSLLAKYDFKYAWKLYSTFQTMRSGLYFELCD